MKGYHMARKLFFAAFVIDEESYTPEPGPVDRHFVCSDLAQSNFGVQPGVSNVIVWDTIEDLISEHRRRGPITIDYLKSENSAAPGHSTHVPAICPPKRRNVGDGICARADVDLKHSPDTRSSTGSSSSRKRSFRDHLSPVMRTAPAFEYYEIRPCIEHDRRVTSFRDEGDYAAELVGLQNWGEAFRTFWTLYGIDAGAHTAIGDFASRDTAHEVMNAILAVPAAARNAINAGHPVRSADGSGIEIVAGRAADWLDDMINQSSNSQRI